VSFAVNPCAMSNDEPLNISTSEETLAHVFGEMANCDLRLIPNFAPIGQIPQHLDVNPGVSPDFI